MLRKSTSNPRERNGQKSRRIICKARTRRETIIPQPGKVAVKKMLNHRGPEHEKQGARRKRSRGRRKKKTVVQD